MTNGEQLSKKNSAARKAISIALSALIILMAGVVAFVMIMNAKGKAVSFFGKSVLTVVTGSMEPSIHEGDYIIIEKTSADELKVNDIITFVSRQEDIKGMYVTHRIIGIEPDGSFVTKGDANNEADRLSVKSDEILGRYTGRARFFELIGSFANVRKLILLLVIIPLALVSLYEVKTLAKLFIESRVEQKLNEKELKEKLIREEIEKEKQRLREREISRSGVETYGSDGDNEKEDD
ncbi:MAG: signal peptidase I [Ruminococcus sp.]|nr:signal peptidase I [Ruminococcus sp.]